MLAAELECNPPATDLYMALPQCRYAERPRVLRVALGADTEPGAVDETGRDRRHAFAVEGITLHVFGHCRTQIREMLGEADQSVVLRLLLLRPEVRVVDVLPPSRRVDTGRLELGGRSGRDPDVLPCRGDHE